MLRDRIRSSLGRYVATFGVLLVACGLGFANTSAHAQSAAGVGTPFELTFWQSVATSEDRAQYEAYLAQYPAGTFSALARAKSAAIDKARGVSAPAPAPVA